MQNRRRPARLARIARSSQPWRIAAGGLPVQPDGPAADGRISGQAQPVLAAWSDGSQLGRGLAIVMALNAAIGAWYYLRLIALMFLEPATQIEAPSRRRIAWSSWLGRRRVHRRHDLLFIAPQWLWDILP